MRSRPVLATMSVVFVLIMTGIHFASQPVGTTALGPALITGTTSPPQRPRFELHKPSGEHAKTIEPAELLLLNAADATAKFRIVASNLDGLSGELPGVLILLAAGREIDRNSAVSGTASGTFNWDNVDLSEIANKGEHTLTLDWIPPGESRRRSSVNELRVKLDTRGPILDTVQLTGQPDFGQTLVLTFDDDDLDRTSVNPTSIQVHLMLHNGSQGSNLVTDDNLIFERGRIVRIVLGRLQVGTYKLVVKGKNTDGNFVRDLVGNPAGGGRDQERGFSSEPAPEAGPRIEFPEFLPTREQPRPERRPNPGDRVESRVARLYYYRDAHRVSQILNRITQSYNRAAVTQAQRRAEEARRTAEELTDDRRAKERAAIEAAQATRRKERQLQSLYQDVERLNQDRIRLQQAQLQGTLTAGTISQGQLRDVTIENAVLESDPQSPEAALIRGTIGSGTIKAGRIVNGKLKEGVIDGQQVNGYIVAGDIVQAEIRGGVVEGLVKEEEPAEPGEGAGNEPNNSANAGDAKTIIARTVSGAELVVTRIVGATVTPRDSEFEKSDAQIRALHQQRPELEAEIARLRANELRVAEEARQLEAKEDRAIAEQFRLDVAAAHEDPDTYAPAKLDSVDPVAQVSISVIGEGLLHLRGPIRGINTIRRMIHQIDSPVGQVKVQIHTVQFNGERGDRMENVASRIEGQIDLSRFLTNQSLLMLRRAILLEAAQVAQIAGHEGHYQVDRDRRYLYHFFGRDFIDELYEMDSEFLHSENKLLSLHSMDTISLNQALFIMALARNDVRERIVSRFLHLVQTELPLAEWDFRRSSGLYPPVHRLNPRFWDPQRREREAMERVFHNAQERYHFRNVRAFFEKDGAWCPTGTHFPPYGQLDGIGYIDPNTMNSMQRTFLRLAQIFKSQMVAEVEVKQRVIERALIEDDRELSFEQEDQIRERRRQRWLDVREGLEVRKIAAQNSLGEAITAVEAPVRQAQILATTMPAQTVASKQIKELVGRWQAGDQQTFQDLEERREILTDLAERILLIFPQTTRFNEQVDEAQKKIRSAANADLKARTLIDELNRDEPEELRKEVSGFLDTAADDLLRAAVLLHEAIRDEGLPAWENIRQLLEQFRAAVDYRDFDWVRVSYAYRQYEKSLLTLPPSLHKEIMTTAHAAFTAARAFHVANEEVKTSDAMLAETRAPLNHKKLLDFLIDEREEKYIELLEGTRSYIAAVDQYLKRLSTALEDDFKVQFYDPAFTQVRAAARDHQVTLGQVERTSLLMNNRALAIVRPSATMEFDLPKRDIVIVEAMEGAKALAQDYGALLNDPTFLAAFQMMGGAAQPGVIRNLYPGLGQTTDEHAMGLTTPETRPSPSALQALVPEPAIYKFETGTGFEIRPVIQPDGDSVVYDFHYMYTTNVREPVRADEKHLGRIKRHFIDTQVQTSSFELREISRYQVALKAARTSRGVPLLEDIPVAGVLFRPLPSAESSLQQNIILGQSTVYPTLFDLMGLRWARHIVDLDHLSLRDLEHVVRGRNMTIEDSVFESSSEFVDKFLDLEQQHLRPDLYRQQRSPSPYHPGGFLYRAEGLEDPRGEDFRIQDRRPQEMQMSPPYDDRFRRPYTPETHHLEPFESRHRFDAGPEQLQLTPPAMSSSRYTPSAITPVSFETLREPATRDWLHADRLPAISVERADELSHQ